SASGPPDLIPDGDGFAATTLAPVPGDAPGAPGKKEVWPAYVRFGPDLNVRASEPIRAVPFGQDGLPDLTWALGCSGDACATLASGTGPGAPLAIVSLPVRTSTWKAPAWRDA